MFFQLKDISNPKQFLKSHFLSSIQLETMSKADINISSSTLAK